ncbi:MAG TPA: hypothetical protein VMH78_07535 [Thermoplasmata archaeon]|nr:hypothetical protein [Thermoplasmata archaeon]
MVPNQAAFRAGPVVQPDLIFDLTDAIRRDPYLMVQKSIPRIYLKWYLPTFLVVILLLLWRRPPLAFTPGLVEFVAIGGCAVTLVSVMAYFYLRGPRPRRLPVRLVVKGDGLEFGDSDGERHNLNWDKPGLWLEVSRPAYGPRKWDPKAGELVVEKSSGPAAVADRRMRMFQGAVPSAILRCGGFEAALSDPAVDALLQGAKRAGCRVRQSPGNRWDSWLIQEPLTRPSFWKD